MQKKTQQEIELNKKVGASFKKARESKHLTQAQVAEHLLVTTRHIQRIEKGEGSPSIELFHRMLAYYTLAADAVLNPDMSTANIQKAQLQYLIDNKCDEGDIQVLLATATALKTYKE